MSMRAAETTPDANAPPLLIQEGSCYGSPPQMRRGGAPSDGVVLSRRRRSSKAVAAATALQGLRQGHFQSTAASSEAAGRQLMSNSHAKKAQRGVKVE
jgi:hypothetical protein